MTSSVNRDETVLYSGGRFYAAADPRATAMLVSGGRIGWLGAVRDAPSADVVVDLAGALVTPAFVDAHVHATDSGLVLRGLDLSGVRSAAELLAAVLTREEPIVIGHGWDESVWPDPTLPTAEELDRASGGRPVYLSQASVHAALVSRSLLARTAYRDAGGLVKEERHHAVREVALGSLTAGQRVAAQRVALEHAASRGVAAVHECGGPGTSSEADFVSVLGLSGRGLPEVFGYWGELGAAEKARELGATGAGGDLFADGAFGSRTAWLREPYADGSGVGEAFLSARQVGDHVLACERLGVQAGFHAIGDAAVEAVLEGYALAAAVVGVDALRQRRHRIEHVELADKAMIARMVEFGLVASVQPVFDAVWGGPGRMYERALGVLRAARANPIGAMYATGVTLAFGSDSPVTPLDPWAAVVAAAAPSNPVHRMSVRGAFGASTRGGWRAVGVDDAGVLAPGARATFAVWETPSGLEGGLPALLPDVDGVVPRRPVCRRTVLAGETIFEE
jgi:predicted amidohydrolase YtcJ